MNYNMLAIGDITFGSDGLLYYCYGTINVIDVKTMEYRSLLTEGIFDYAKARIFDIGPDGNLYYAKSNELKVLPVTYKNPVTIKDSGGGIITKLSAGCAGTDISANVPIEGMPYEDSPLTVVFALYDCKNKLLNLEISKNELQSGDVNEVKVILHIPEGTGNGSYAKVMVLNNLQDVKPILTETVLYADSSM